MKSPAEFPQPGGGPQALSPCLSLPTDTHALQAWLGSPTAGWRQRQALWAPVDCLGLKTHVSNWQNTGKLQFNMLRLANAMCPFLM